MTPTSMTQKSTTREKMTRERFIARYGALYEHSPWIAERAFDGGADPLDPLPAMRRVVERAEEAAQLALLTAHPDLAERVGTLTAASSEEQAGAGLDACTPQEAAEFHELNARYKAQNGFPFILAVRGRGRTEILAAFRERATRPREVEFAAALDEVHKIAALRLDAGRPETPRESLSAADAHALALAVLKRAGADDANAAAIADTVVAAERDGSESHGLFRLPGYAAALAGGHLNGRAAPRITGAPPAVVRVDGDAGSASMAYTLGLPALAERARELGVAVLALANTRHFSAMWHEVEWLAERGLAAFAATANFAYLAPHGGRRPMFGTNPIAFAYPRVGAPPLVFDFATSAMARGDIMLAARDDRSVPWGTGVDATGEPTRDPEKILSGGAQLPFGGHKGSALALMVELLVGGIVGDGFSVDAAVDASGVPPGGVFVLAIDAGAIGGEAVQARAEGFLARVSEEPGVRLPGSRRHQRRARNAALDVPAALLEQLRELAGES